MRTVYGDKRVARPEKLDRRNARRAKVATRRIFG
ncbi:hypothetical protein LAV_00217 [Sphingobium phage Lacusarx]|uniref:Uncharacterized protein n=1 Tax=Sphingobium phage Lacusarx TaxID=1980139 RepID=A0A1W6DXU4_9CAUD|nr:hypothetical protein FDH44_gp086 [Sphingobium phage Lacusarx]ARK07592.1 hypothetical protein LAV_00217 [Sphingobium phage Lacusarx]